MNRSSRPLSPHLGIYRLSMTMLMSVAHRLTGLGLYGGMAVFVGYLAVLAAGPPWYDCVQPLAMSGGGRFGLFVFVWVLCHHLIGGVRHLIWDTGTALSIRAATLMAWGTLLGGFVLAVLGCDCVVWPVMKDGTSHFIHQRLTAVANLPLTLLAVSVLLKGVTATHAAAMSLVSPWWVKVALGLFVLNAVWHMFLGMDTIIHDYLQDPLYKKIASWGNTGFCVLLVGVGEVSLVLLALR